MEGLVEGRIVHYVMPNGEHRPAIVVRVWRQRGPDDENGQVWMLPENGLVNLQVFVDGTNDVVPATGKDNVLTLWETSREYSKDPTPFTWHWIERA